MGRVNFKGGSYNAPSLIAAAQRCLNLIPEVNPESSQNPRSPIQYTDYQRPGLTLLNPCPNPGRGRGLYCATNGDLYAVVDTGVYYINPDWGWTLIGNLLVPGGNPVSMVDNGSNVVIVDGSANGNAVNLTAPRPPSAASFSLIGDPNFLGADRLDYIDSFFVLNQPATPNWYSSLSNQVSFNALDFGTKTAWPDNILTLAAVHRLVWLFGPYKSEIWFNAGGAAFPFQAMPGVIIEHGCAAKYSVATQDVAVYWLSQSPEGARMAMKGSPDLYAKRISTHAVEAEWKKYPRVDDAIGGCYQSIGHAFYLIHFPTADKTWAYDEATELWHERAAMDINGALHRTMESFYAFAYGVNVGLDFSTGALYAIDAGQYVDQSLVGGNPAIAPIECIRSSAHFIGEKFERMEYPYIIADVEVGTEAGTGTNSYVTSPWSLAFSNAFGPRAAGHKPQISMRLSFDRGASWGNKRTRSLGTEGQYDTIPTWWQNGEGRGMVAEFSWAEPMKIALNGMFTDPQLFES
jgi:hypothetical protein